MAKKRDGFASSRIPLYYQLENVLREKIISGAYIPGEQLPTESDFIDQFGVSRITVRQALSALAEEGLIERRQGSGTFVAQRKSRKRMFEGEVHLSGSLDELIEMGSDSSVKLLEINRITADKYEAELLQVKKGTTIYVLKRLRTSDGSPQSLIVNYLPEEIGEKLTDKELNSGTILQTIENKLGYRLQEARQQIKAVLSDPYVSELLDIRVGSALLSAERTVFADNGKPVEYVQIFLRSDKFGFSIFFKRNSGGNNKKK